MCSLLEALDVHIARSKIAMDTDLDVNVNIRNSRNVKETVWIYKLFLCVLAKTHAADNSC